MISIARTGKLALVLILVFVAPSPLRGGDGMLQQNAPCEEGEEFRQFDFWLGVWDVFNAEGRRVGRNEIIRLPGGCALLESWTGGGGSVGNSINFYDPGKRQWIQTWVGGTAYVIEMSGQYSDGAMRLEGRYAMPDGQEQPFRGTWTLLDDGRVRQLLETAKAEGEPFETWFDGYYVRIEGDGNGDESGEAD